MAKITSYGYLYWLWWIVWLNIGFGAVLWTFNSIYLGSEDLSASEIANAIAWQSTGVDLMGFGILALVIALAASALVEAQAEAL
jgi:hypothetical protein